MTVHKPPANDIERLDNLLAGCCSPDDDAFDDEEEMDAAAAAAGIDYAAWGEEIRAKARAHLDAAARPPEPLPELSDHDFEAVIPALSDTAFEALASRRLAHDPALDPRYERRIRALPPAGSDPDACRTSRRSEGGADHDARPRAMGRTRTDTVPVDEFEAR